MDEILEVLVYLHGRSPPVIHRDIKPANLMRRPDGSLALIDFGSVRDILRDARMGGSTVAGTFGYMAPEQFAGDATPATDIYALGATAIALLSRQQPSALHTREGQFRWQQSVQLSAATESLIAELVSIDPSARPVDLRALRARIRRLRASSPSPELSGPRGSDTAPVQAAAQTQTRQKDLGRANFAALFEFDQPLIRSEDRATLAASKLRLAARRTSVAVSVLFLLAAMFLARSQSTGGRYSGPQREECAGDHGGLHHHQAAHTDVS